MNVTNIDTMDRENFHETSAKIEKVSKIRESVRESDPGMSGAFDDLLEDGFGLMYKYAPHIKDKVSPDRKVNKKVADELVGLSEYERLRRYTKGNATNSNLSLDMVARVFDELPDDVKNEHKKTQAAQERLEDIFANGDPQGADSAEFQQALDALKEVNESLDNALAANEDEIRQAVRSAANEAAEDADSNEQALNVFGMGSDSTEIASGMTTEARAKLAGMIKNNSRLREIVKMAGRMKQIAFRKQAERCDYERQELQGVEYGNDLMKMTPSARMLLANGDGGLLEGLFFKRFMNRNLMQYKVTGKDTKARGPIVVPVDCSGSMTGAPDTWSKALALAMYMIARKQKRDFAFFLFNTKVVKKVFIGKNETEPLGLAEILGHGVGGGTSFEVPLDESMSLINNSKEFDKADIVFVTDGECHTSPEWLAKFNKWREDRGVNVVTLFVNTYRRGDISEMKRFSHEVVNLSGDLIKNEDAAFDAAFTI